MHNQRRAKKSGRVRVWRKWRPTRTGKSDAMTQGCTEKGFLAIRLSLNRLPDRPLRPFLGTRPATLAQQYNMRPELPMRSTDKQAPNEACLLLVLDLCLLVCRLLLSVPPMHGMSVAEPSTCGTENPCRPDRSLATSVHIIFPATCL